MGSVLSVKSVLVVLVIANIIVIYSDSNPFRINQQITNPASGIHKNDADYNNYLLTKMIDPSQKNGESSETTALEEAQKKIELLEKQLRQSKEAIGKFKKAKDELREKANLIKENLDLAWSKYKNTRDTGYYVNDVLLNSNPFKKLGAYEDMPESYYNFKTGGRFLPGIQYYGIKHNPNYCDAVDLYNFHNPDNIFKNMNFITDYADDETLIREEVMKRIGQDVMPNVTMDREDLHQLPLFEMAINGTMFFLKKSVIHSIYEVGKEWACLSQLYNHIPGNGVLTRKDLLVTSVNDYTEKYINKPACIQKDSFFPESFRLNIESECKQFFSIINSPTYKKAKKNEPIQYLIKYGNGAHRAMGVFLFDNRYERKLRADYENGDKCGEVTSSWVAQKYIANPLLLDKQNKFDFRIYMLVASVDPLIVYYHDGFLRVSLSKYDKHSKEKNVHFTNTHLSKKIFSEAEGDGLYDGMTEAELREYQMWTMEDLEAYLLKIGKIKDKNWLDNYLRPKFKEAFVHIARMAEDSFYKNPSMFEMYGLDFVMDEDTNIFLIECNASPQMVGTSERKTKFLVKTIEDLFEIQYSYLRSRMKRVYSFIRNIDAKAQSGKPVDYDQLKEQFKKVNINKLEPEFQISPDNSFSLILDKNIEGPGAYFGHISKECIE